MTRRAGASPGDPTVRGAVCVLVYTAAFVAAALVGFASLPRRIERPVQRAVLRPAAWSGPRVDWAAHGWVARARRRLGTAGPVRAFARAVLDDALSPVDEDAGYVGTVDPPGDDPVGWLERRLAAAGFRRNPTAYLEYRDRDGRQFERSSWALRSSVAADRQLHVRLFESDDGTADVYGHREPSVTAGADHYGTPDYRAGVAMALAVLDRAGVTVERRGDAAGGPPGDIAPDVDTAADASGEGSAPAGVG